VKKSKRSFLFASAFGFFDSRLFEICKKDQNEQSETVFVIVILQGSNSVAEKLQRISSRYWPKMGRIQL